ncbi:MAG: BolA family protein [Acidiferrobacterales bacterium]
MTTQGVIEKMLNDELEPLHLEVVDESSMHNVPLGSESHFKVTVVSQQFEGEMLVVRHRLVNDILADLLNSQIHALALHTLTPDEWFERGNDERDSPPCLGGSKADG